MTSQSGLQTIAIHILPNASRTKGNQTMKFNQLIEYNMRKISVYNHRQNVLEKLLPDPYLKKPKLSISQDPYHKVLNSLLPLYANLRAIEI